MSTRRYSQKRYPLFRSPGAVAPLCMLRMHEVHPSAGYWEDAPSARPKSQLSTSSSVITAAVESSGKSNGAFASAQLFTPPDDLGSDA